MTNCNRNNHGKGTQENNKALETLALIDGGSCTADQQPAQETQDHATAANAGQFWFITIALTVFVQIVLILYVYPVICAKMFDDKSLMLAAVIGSSVAGVVGSVVFNMKWAPGKSRESYAWWEYVLSVLTALGFAFGFGIVMCLLIPVSLFVAIGALIILIICLAA